MGVEGSPSCGGEREPGARELAHVALLRLDKTRLFQDRYLLRTRRVAELDRVPDKAELRFLCGGKAGNDRQPHRRVQHRLKAVAGMGARPAGAIGGHRCDARHAPMKKGLETSRAAGTQYAISPTKKLNCVLLSMGGCSMGGWGSDLAFRPLLDRSRGCASTRSDPSKRPGNRGTRGPG